MFYLVFYMAMSLKLLLDTLPHVFQSWLNCDLLSVHNCSMLPLSCVLSGAFSCADIFFKRFLCASTLLYSFSTLEAIFLFISVTIFIGYLNGLFLYVLGHQSHQKYIIINTSYLNNQYFACN